MISLAPHTPKSHMYPSANFFILLCIPFATPQSTAPTHLPLLNKRAAASLTLPAMYRNSELWKSGWLPFKNQSVPSPGESEPNLPVSYTTPCHEPITYPSPLPLHPKPVCLLAVGQAFTRALLSTPRALSPTPLSPPFLQSSVQRTMSEQPPLIAC